MIDSLRNEQSILLVGHRGYKSAYPENTLLAFAKSLEMGIDVLEFDLRMTKDKVVAVIHDETVDRTTNGTGKVNEYTIAELKRLDAGGWFDHIFAGLKIPTLEELCKLLQAFPNVLLNVEIKRDVKAKETADLTIAMLAEYGYLSRCVFTSFDADIVAYIHDDYQLKTQGFPEELMSNFDPGMDGTYSKMWSVGISMKLLTAQRVQRFREMGMVIGCYCTDTEEQVNDALRCGVTLLTCNDPLPAMRIRENIQKG
ncbi:glycerophosphodiester phosphodiesterase family protein [Paenibacillus allorhizosphaerae]|uniref:Glycerophosphodiester phosphodiesterase n=1 Tax=Paenibacillus allorhizosphaerae TaxID=2849866 RepID=A0ABM8V9T0_9BACL|nr:glycerophosphodiester phosphodiesterase family protein [Paenibacillus allorhizosphaerae]CAG7614292.1 Glycerophosphodiester phosphodiesterase [Paenibacillus allorhizosphaerae]